MCASVTEFLENTQVRREPFLKSNAKKILRSYDKNSKMELLQ